MEADFSGRLLAFRLGNMTAKSLHTPPPQRINLATHSPPLHRTDRVVLRQHQFPQRTIRKYVTVQRLGRTRDCKPEPLTPAQPFLGSCSAVVCINRECGKPVPAGFHACDELQLLTFAGSRQSGSFRWNCGRELSPGFKIAPSGAICLTTGQSAATRHCRTPDGRVHTLGVRS